MIRGRLLATGIVCAVLLMVTVAYGDDADVLPKGVFSAKAAATFFLPVSERYGPDGNVEDVDTDYNTSLDSRVFPALGGLEAAFSPLIPGFEATLGDSDVNFEYDVTRIFLTFMYGVTDKFTLGLNVPYWWSKNTVSAELITANATVGANPLHGSPGDPFAGTAPLIPIALGGQALTKDDVIDLLGDGLDVNGDGTVDVAGFGYEDFETWSDEGIGDIELGGRYQYYKSENWRLAFTGGVRFPTSEVDNTDNLVDNRLSNETYGLFFHFNHDYTGIEDVLLNATFRYDLMLPDKEVKRVPDDVNLPITANKEEVDRDIGDVMELEASGSYTFAKGASVSLLYKFGYKFKDEVEGDQGFAYESLEDETNYVEHVGIIGVSYSTVPLYVEKKFPVPLMVSLSYRNRFAGKNLFKSQYVGLGLQVFF